MADPTRRGVYVRGNGPIWVPEARLQEISKVVSEQHHLDAERAALIVTQMRRTV